MFSKRIVESSRFLKLPDNVQNLYFHLMMNTDDDGIVEAFTVLRICGATMEDLEQLEAAGLVCRLNDDLVAYMEDWREQNTLRADRKKDSIYLDLLRRKRPDVQVLEKKARSDSKTRKEDDSQGQTMDGPWTAQDKISQSNIIESKVMKDQSIFQSAEREKERSIKNTQTYRKLIADNISLDYLLDSARRHSPAEVEMVNEIYDTICDMVCFPRETVIIKKAARPWEVVKSQFLKLKYDHVANVLNRIIDQDLHIRNMKDYLVTTLYEESMSGTLSLEASLHDGELKLLRGQPY
jgi:hypothetical protein